MQAVVLAAGRGTRMRSEHPKVLHEILGRPLLDYVLETLESLGVRNPKVVVGAGGKEVCSFIEKRNTARKVKATAVWQHEQKGTGHAVQMAEKSLAGEDRDLLIWPGDMPVLTPGTLKRFIRSHRESGAQASVLSSLQRDPAGYGRILRAGGQFYAIREELDAGESERRIQEVNSGVYLFKTPVLFGALKKIRPANSKKELYLTDTVEVLAKYGAAIEAFPFAGEKEASGINSRMDLAMATKIMTSREIQGHMERGVSFISPDQTFVEPGAKIGPDTVIEPWTYIEAGVKIGKGCHIGPFAKLRKGSEIGDGTIIGSFVEVNRSKLGKKVLAKHLAYLGDAVIGDETNVGAGAITANFDGRNKHVTRIGKKVFIGSNTVFVAPVTLSDFSKTGAGAVVTAGTRVKKGEVVAGIPARPLAKKRKN